MNRIHNRSVAKATAITLSLSAVLLMSCAQTPSVKQNSGDYPAQARVDPIEIINMNARQKELLGIVDGKPLPKRAQSNLFKTLMHNPELFAVYDPMGYAVNRSADISDKHRELIIMRTSWNYQGRYEWSQHYNKALAVGWSKEDIERIKIGPDAAGWTDFERTLLQAGDQLVATASIEDDVWASLSKEYSPAQVMTFITLITHYHWVAMISKSMGIQPNFPVTAFDSPPE